MACITNVTSKRTFMRTYCTNGYRQLSHSLASGYYMKALLGV